MVNQQQQNNFQVKQNQAAAQETQNSGKCRHCGHITTAGADICESCGAWQLEGQCCFCYAAVKPGQKFCGGCGNPPEGITCKQCGTHSISDFCPKCTNTVSRDAAGYLEQFKKSSEVVEILQQVNTLNADMEAISASQTKKTEQPADTDWLNQLENYEKRFQQDSKAEQKAGQEPVPPPKFTFGTDGNKDVSQALSSADQVAKLPDLMALEQRRAELESKIAALQQRAFSNNQEARKFYTSLRVTIPQIRTVETVTPVVVGWQCNFAGLVHPRPENCERPGLGGVWVTDFSTSTEKKIVYNEI